MAIRGRAEPECRGLVSAQTRVRLRHFLAHSLLASIGKGLVFRGSLLPDADLIQRRWSKVRALDFASAATMLRDLATLLCLVQLGVDVDLGQATVRRSSSPMALMAGSGEQRMPLANYSMAPRRS